MSGYYWLASYPKSGNTWLRLALFSLSKGGAPLDFSADIDFAPLGADCRFLDVLLDVEPGDLTTEEAEILRPRLYEAEARAAAKPLLRKVHDARTMTTAGEPLFPPAVTLGAVYIVRDPRDVAVSLAHHLGKTQDEAIDFMAAPGAELAPRRNGGKTQLRQRLLSWSMHVESWLTATAPPRPLLLRYEEMTSDAPGSLLRVARHLGWSVTPADVARAANAARFDVLRAAEERDGFQERSSRTERFFRRGVAGGWRDALTPLQAKRIEHDHAEVMALLGYG